MECKFIKKLKDTKSIVEFQGRYLYIFPRDFLCFIKDNNGGRPQYKTYNTNSGSERDIKSFLSFNREDIENIWDMVTMVQAQDLIPFGLDNFGNLICFDRKSNAVVFWDHENCSIEFIANSFSVFIESLH